MSKKHFLAEIEESVIKSWQKDQTFKQSLQNSKDKSHFEFYDGPPFANGLPHYGHVVSSIVKDAIPRYKTMRGYHVPRRFGWDCHGLPAEIKAEQDLSLGSKADIEKYGVEKFVEYCRESVTRFTKEWEDYVDRIGRWVDFEDNYYTMDQSYMESVMWAFKKLYDEGLVSKGFKVMPHCHVCETSLSHFESRQDESYRERVDPAVTVRFPLENGLTALAWTTTPWTLPANLALAVNKTLEYAVVEGEGERLVLSKKALKTYESELKDYKKVDSIKGKDLVGLKYTPPFDYFANHPQAHQVLHADFVTDEDGTGIAHEAPGFGEEDQIVAEANGIEIVVPVDKQGNYTEEIKDFHGLNVFDANSKIVDHLKNQKTLFKFEEYAHMYPHCWRTDNPLIYRAVSSWFIDVPKFKDKLLANNQQINWVPANVKDGAFGKWLEGVRVWNVSRDRYWGAPIPVWETIDGSETIVVGSMEEIKQRAVNPEALKDLHRPHIDNVILETDSGKKAYRVSEIFDVWFESGSMPFAQHHYPFGNEEDFKSPADFIVEYIGQVRGWFYTLHVLSTILFDKPAFSNVISHGVILGSDNRKMSKRLGNYPDLGHVFDTYGADAMRYYLFESPIINGETIAVDESAIRDAQRNVIMTFYNSFKFFKTYQEVDDWQPPQKFARPKVEHSLDDWILSRLDQTIEEVTKHSDKYDIPRAVRPIRGFLDDLSNWYIRRSRRRFWKSDSDADKTQAYETLWYVLIQTSKIMAPWTPFIAEHVYQNLRGEKSDLPASVHLCDWPDSSAINQEMLEYMASLRAAISVGLAIRAEASIKVRQPLQSATILGIKQLKKFSVLRDIAADELNVHKVEFKPGANVRVELDTEITRPLKLEGVTRDIIRHVQNKRKEAGLNVEDRIKLNLSSDDDLITEAIEKHSDEIASETLAVAMGNADPEKGYTAQATIDKKNLKVVIEKANV